MPKTKQSYSRIHFAILIILTGFIYFILSFNICVIGKNASSYFLYFTVISMSLIAFLGVSEDRYTSLFRRFILSEIPSVIQIITLPSILIILFNNAESLIVVAPIIYLLVSAYLLEKMHIFVREELFNDHSTFNVFRLSESTLDRKFSRYYAVSIIYISIVVILFVKLLQDGC